MTDTSKNPGIVSSLAWRYGEKILTQGISFIVSLILARLLSPEHYGQIAMVTIFITIADVFISCGLVDSLIQKKDADNVDFSSIFYINVGMAALFYLALFISAPYIAAFYGYDILKPVLRVLGLRLFISSFNTVQHAFIARQMLFKRFFWSSFGGTIISAFVGIVMAYHGYGIWALVASIMTNTVIDTIVLQFTVKWRPQLVFSYKQVKSLLSYGWKLLMAGLLNTLNSDIRQLIIGKLYSSSDLAYFNRGPGFPQIVMDNINSTLDSVIFPYMAKIQDDRECLLLTARQYIRVASYVCFPMLMGMAVVAEPLIKLLLTDKWMPCVPYLQISCYSYAVIITQIAMQNMIKSIGRSDIFLKMDIACMILGLTLFLIVLNRGVMAIALTSIITGTFNYIMKAVIVRHMFDYSYHEQAKDQLSIIISVVMMGACVYLIQFIGLSSILTLVIQVITGAVIYLILSLIFKLEGLTYILTRINSFIKEYKTKGVAND